MTELIIQCKDGTDTFSVDTKSKLLANIKAGLPDIMPGRVQIIVDDGGTEIQLVKAKEKVNIMWEEVRDEALKRAKRMLQAEKTDTADVHQVINLAMRAERRLAGGIEACKEPLTTPDEVHKAARADEKARKAKVKAEKEKNEGATA